MHDKEFNKLKQEFEDTYDEDLSFDKWDYFIIFGISILAIILWSLLELLWNLIM